MRNSFWRRAMAAVAVFIGLAVGASTTPASADDGTSISTDSNVGTFASFSDWWW